MLLCSISSFVEMAMLGSVPGTSCLWSRLETKHPTSPPSVVIWSSHVDRRGLSLEAEPCHLLAVWFRESYLICQSLAYPTESVTITTPLGCCDIRLDSMCEKSWASSCGSGLGGPALSSELRVLGQSLTFTSAQFPHLKNEQVGLELWFSNFFFSLQEI